MRAPARIKFYVAAVTVGALFALALTALDTRWDGSPLFVNGLIAIIAVGLAAEWSAVSLQVGSSTVSVAHIPYLAAVMLFDPFWAMLCGGVNLLFVEAVLRRKPWIKVAFNASKEILTLAFAAGVYHALGGRSSVVLDELYLSPVGVFGAGVAYSAGNSFAVGLAVSISEKLSFGQVWARLYAGTVLYDVLATPLPGILAYCYARFELLGVAALSVPLFVVRHIYVQNLRLEQSSRELLELMVKAIEARDPYTSGHSQRVAQYARILAREAGLGLRQVEQIATAALLHDVGKIYEEYAPLLRKEGRLTPEERKLLQSHPVRSADLAGTISSMRGTVSDAIRHHHENFDGTGYPDGLSSERIPLGARIIMVADTIDAMTTDRPYRRALPYDRVLEEVQRYAGKQFDPRLAEILLRSSTIRDLIRSLTPAPLSISEPAVPSVSVRRQRALV